MSEQTTKISVKNFINWLDGVIDMQEEGWVPDAKQWTKILTKIYEIDDSEPKPQHGYQPALPPSVPYAQPVTSYQQPGLTPVVTNSPAQLNIAPSPLNNRVSPLAQGHEQIPVKTPNIDGNYDTPFV